jgi:hypothetical protein
VRMRSRATPGRPNFSRIGYKGREHKLFPVEKNGRFLCNVFYWTPSPEEKYPEYFTLCGPGMQVDGTGDPSKVFYCSQSNVCNWSNNPFVVKRSWWLEQIAGKFASHKVRERNPTVMLSMPVVSARCVCVCVCVCVHPLWCKPFTRAVPT